MPDEYINQTCDALIVTEQEKASLLEVAHIIEIFSKKGRQFFEDYGAKLKYVSNLLPPVFSDVNWFGYTGVE